MLKISITRIFWKITHKKITAISGANMLTKTETWEIVSQEIVFLTWTATDNHTCLEAVGM